MQLLKGDALTLNGPGVFGSVGGWSTHSGGGSDVTVASGMLTAPTGPDPATFYFLDSYPNMCVKDGEPAQVSAVFSFGAPTFGGAVIPDDFDPAFEWISLVWSWLTPVLTLAGPQEFSDDYPIGLTDTTVNWSVAAAPATAKFFQLQVDIDGGLGSHFTLYMTDPSIDGVSCSGVRLRQFPRDDTLGGAPRQDRSSTSVQGSQRQGWIGTYR